jgi:ubiquinone/menaquinone biosynthesis C-methylase UbiE
LGTDLLQFARAGADVTGIDLTPASIELTRKRFSLYGIQAQLHVADAEDLPFPDATFDVVYSFGVLHHTPNTQKTLDEVLRVLKPGGEMIVMLYHKNSLHVFAGVPLAGLARWVKRTAQRESVSTEWIRIYDGKENPLGKAYSKSEVRRLTRQFKNIRFELCDPVRRRYPALFNWVNQTILAPLLGFYLIVRGEK